MYSKPKHTLLALAVAGGFLAAGGASAEMISPGMLADTCNGCHGPNGSTYGPATPSIAGTNEAYLVDAMEAYKSGARASTIMGRIAKGYSSEELKTIAKYFAQKELVRRLDQPADAASIATGEETTRKLCQDCHEKDGYSAIDYPSLAGQPKPYLGYQLADFLSGARDIDKNEAMSDKEKRKKKRALMDAQEAGGVSAIIDFYGSRK